MIEDCCREYNNCSAQSPDRGENAVFHTTFQENGRKFEKNVVLYAAFRHPAIRPGAAGRSQGMGNRGLLYCPVHHAGNSAALSAEGHSRRRCDAAAAAISANPGGGAPEPERVCQFRRYSGPYRSTLRPRVSASRRDYAVLWHWALLQWVHLFLINFPVDCRGNTVSFFEANIEGV